MSEAFDFSNYEFYRLNNLILKYQRFTAPETEFKEFEPRLNDDWFNLKLYQMFQD